VYFFRKREFLYEFTFYTNSPFGSMLFMCRFTIYLNHKTINHLIFKIILIQNMQCLRILSVSFTGYVLQFFVTYSFVDKKKVIFYFWHLQIQSGKSGVSILFLAKSISYITVAENFCDILSYTLNFS
jgi:hypothetical protein